MPPDVVTAAVLAEIRPGECLGMLLDRLERAWPRPVAKAAVLRLLWQRRVSTDLAGPGCRQHRGGDPVNGTLRGLLAVGTRLAYDGQWWQVAEMDGPHVLLASPAGVRRVSAGHLLADPSTRLGDAPRDPVEGTGPELAGLGEAELAELRERIAHVQEVRTGFRRGCAELAADGEPRPEYAPGVPVLARYAAKAAEIGVGVSTLRRWVKYFGERGPAGLADDRWRRRQQPLAGADPRWLEMARRVLAEHTEASKPTRDLILAEVTARLGAEHGHGAVQVPAQTRGWTTLGVSPFEIGTEAGRQTWWQLLLAIEKGLVLAGACPGMVADDLADYLFARSTGHFASLMTLIVRGCRRAIRAGTEQLTRDLLDQVRNDAAAEAARQELLAAFDAGRLSARSAASSAARAASLAAAG